MNAKYWTEQDVDRLLHYFHRGESCSEIAKILGRTETSIRLKILSLGFSSRRLIPEQTRGSDNPKDLTDAVGAQEDSLRIRAENLLESNQMRRSERARLEEAKQTILEDRLVEQFRKQLADFPTRIQVELPPPVSKTSSEDIAVLVVGDVHVGQVVDPAESDGIGNYNPAVMIARIHHLQCEVIRILQQRPVKKLLLLFSGDILHGHLGHSLEDDLTIPLALQMELAVSTFFPFVAHLGSVVPEMEIHGICGNHGRWPGMRKMPTDRRWSNLDGVFYSFIGMLCQHSRLPVKYKHGISARRSIDADGFNIELLHGDEVRGGSFAVNGMSREVTQATLRYIQNGRPAPDLYIIGDKHFQASLPFGTGAFLVNGSVVGPDNYSLNFIPSPPSQTLFFLEKGIGRTQTHEIRLGHARPAPSLPYEYKPHLLDCINRYR